MIWHISSVAFLCFSTFAGALPPYPAPPAATITLPPHSGHPANISQLLADRIYNPGLDKRQSGVIGTGICASAMNGFTCDASRHEENRCAGDQYSCCICAGSASMPGRDPQGLWLNTAWGPGCYACSGKERGHIFDGTCNGDGTGGRGQCISEILRTLTITLTEWTYSTLSPDATRTRIGTGTGTPPRAPSTTITQIVTVTNVSASTRRLEGSVGFFLLGSIAIVVRSLLL